MSHNEIYSDISERLNTRIIFPFEGFPKRVICSKIRYACQIDKRLKLLEVVNKDLTLQNWMQVKVLYCVLSLLYGVRKLIYVIK